MWPWRAHVGTLGFLCKHSGKVLGGRSNRGRESGVGWFGW